MSDEALKPCPICGKKVSIARTENEVGERWWFITRGTYRTTRCNCRLFLESEKFTCGWNDDYALECRAKLIDKWNTRATHGTLTAEQVREAIEKRFDFDVWVPPARWQAIADELNAERHVETCEPVETEAITYYDEYGHDAVKVHFMECDRCGGTYEHVNGAYEHCPRCGKAVG